MQVKNKGQYQITGNSSKLYWLKEIAKDFCDMLHKSLKYSLFHKCNCPKNWHKGDEIDKARNHHNKI